MITNPSGITNPSLYLGQVATRAQVSDNFDTAAGTTWGMARSTHWARDNINGLTIVYGNYYINNSTNSETTGSAATMKVSVEYPLGTIIPCNEGTQAVGIGGNGTFTCPSVVIPNGAQFWLRVLQTNATVVPYKSFLLNNGCDPSEGYVKGNGAPSDLTGGGAVTSIGAFNNSRCYYPVAILSLTRRPSVMIIGDSRNYGSGDIPNDISSDTGEICRCVGPYFGYSNLSVPSVKGSDFLINTKTSRMALVSYFSHVVVALGTNDITGGGASAATAAATRASLAALFPNKIVIGSTLSPFTSTSDAYATTTNQTEASTGKVAALNALIRAGIVGEKFLIDIADAVDPLRLAVWPVSRNVAATSGSAGFATTDGIHATAAMSVLIRKRIDVGNIQR